MSTKKRFTVKGLIGYLFYNSEEWKIDREEAFQCRLVNRITGKKKWVKKEYFEYEERNYPYR